MKRKQVIIAGGTGFIGSFLKDRFITDGFDVSVISRNKGDIQWNDHSTIISKMNGSEALINLTGKSVDCRYSNKNKWEILTSRTQSTLDLHSLVAQCSIPPKIWFNSSTATIYRHAEDYAMTELNGEIGTGFSVHVAQMWESAFFSKNLSKTHQVALRMAIVLGKGGALKPMINLAKFGFGGRHGSGKQQFSWIHIEDVYQIIRFIMNSNKPNSIYNCSSPNPVMNEEIMATLTNQFLKKRSFNLNESLIKFGAAVIRTEPELLLKSRWVIPENLIKEGYQFTFPNLDLAIKDIIKKNTL